MTPPPPDGEGSRSSQVQSRVLARVVPAPDEAAAMEAMVSRLVEAAVDAARAAGVAADVTIQGSIAKGTWLSGAGDVDLFLMFPEGTADEDLAAGVEAVAPRLLGDRMQKYAQHPYVVGRFEDIEVDLVPACAVAHATDLQSAVDRTPFHTLWVHDSLDESGRQQVRLLKAWLIGVGVYGAETALGGMSGYLAELLIAHHGSFAAVLRWLANDARPRHIQFTPPLDAAVTNTGSQAPRRDGGHAGDAALTIIDPVDPGRNAAAAVRQDTLLLAIEAARAYVEAPGEHFFFPPPPREEEAATLQRRMQDEAVTWLGVLVHPDVEVLDNVFPQFQRGAGIVAAALERAGFPVKRHDVVAHDGHVALQWLAADHALPERQPHYGPPANSRHAARFLDKWKGHEDAAGPVGEEGGRLVVEKHVRHRTAGHWLAAHLGNLQAGRHMAAALEGATLVPSPAAAPAWWRPRIADVVLDRRPWQR